MGGRMMLHPIFTLRSPIKAELFLIHPVVPQPMKAHVHRFRALWLDAAIYDPLSHRVVSLHGSGGLRMPHLLKNGAYFDGFACIDV